VTTEENIEEKIKEYQPGIIAHSVMTGEHGFYSELIGKLKRMFPDMFFLAGGPHPTFFPEFLEQSSLDAICRGEGEEAVVEFLELFEAGKDFTQTRNFWFKKDGRIIRNPVRPLIKNLDGLPFPDRELVYKYPKIRDTEIRHFFFSRGCPFDCSYCFNHSFFELYSQEAEEPKRVRFRATDNLLEEIAQVISQHETRVVYFQDDTFILDREKLKEFAEKYPKKINLPFHCHVRANLVDEEIVSMLKKAGCYSVHMAAETADDYLRNEVLGRRMSREQIVEAARLIKHAGIKLMLQNMIGLPEGNLEKDLETLGLNVACQPECAWVSIYQPYPKTRLGEFCREKGFYSGDFSDIDPNFFDRTVLNFSS
ncbi:MAG: radical SAM protein, partial [Nanoarchaeota archaeon]